MTGSEPGPHTDKTIGGSLVVATGQLNSSDKTSAAVPLVRAAASTDPKTYSIKNFNPVLNRKIRFDIETLTSDIVCNLVARC